MNYKKEHDKYLMPCTNPFNVVFDHGQGCWLYDEKGKKYLDLFSALVVNCLGYSHPAIVKAICSQSKKLIQTSNLYGVKPRLQLAKMLCTQFGGGKVFFQNSGAESIEAAIKLARKYSKKNFGPEKYEFISMNKSFHGRTLAAITATGQTKYQKDLEPLPKGFGYAQFGDLESIKKAITPHTCAIIIEPVQGEGGINTAPAAFWKGLRALCNQKQLLLILDEIQTGIGRTGTFFAYEHYGIKPDIICLAKGLAAGVPIGAVIATDKVSAAFQPGDHASTFGGNALSCAVGIAAVNIVSKKPFLQKVKKTEVLLKKLANDLKKKYSFIKDVRGLGLLYGLQIDDSIKAVDIVAKALDNGLIINSPGNNVIRISPPLIIKEAELKHGFKMLDKILAEFG